MGLQIVQTITLIAFLYRQDGGRPFLPLLFLNGKRAYQATTMRLKKIKTMSKTKITPDVPDELLKQYALILLQEVDQSLFWGNVSLTEQTWIKAGKWKEKTGGSPQQWKDCMARLEAARIVTRDGGKGTRVWALPYNSIKSKLQKIAYAK